MQPLKKIMTRRMQLIWGLIALLFSCNNEAGYSIWVKENINYSTNNFRFMYPTGYVKSNCFFTDQELFSICLKDTFSDKGLLSVIVYDNQSVFSNDDVLKWKKNKEVEIAQITYNKCLELKVDVNTNKGIYENIKVSDLQKIYTGEAVIGINNYAVVIKYIAKYHNKRDLTNERKSFNKIINSAYIGEL